MPYLTKMVIEKIDRTKIFLCIVFFLYLWDVAYFVGLRNPVRFPHPFSLFRILGDVEFLRGFPATLREVIFSFASGSLIGIALGAIVLHSPWLSEAIRRFLRITLWFPLIIIFAGPSPFILGIMAVMLCACYYYVAGRSSLGLEPFHALTYAAREALLQALLISLIGQLWIPHWQWFNFTVFMKIGPGIEAFATLIGLIGFINWCFRSNFELTANRRAAIRRQEIDGKQALGLNCLQTSAIYEFTLLAVACLVIWLFFGAALTAAYNLILHGEIWGDVGLSLLEVLGGIVLGGLAAQGVFLALSKAIVRNLLSALLPITYISAIVWWLVAFVLWANLFGASFLYFWHKAIAVGCLSFYPLVESLWGLRDRPVFYRILLAIDVALPIAFVAMAFGEAYAATQGLGFLMVIANAQGQGEKAIGVSLVTVALMVGLSFMLRWAAKRVCILARTPSIPPA